VRRNAIIATLAAILIVITGAAIFTARRVAERPVFAKRGEGKIAVLPFRNETKSRGSEWIELGVMDMVMQGLGGMHRVQLVPADDVLKAMKNLGVAHGAELPDVTRGRLLEALGADTLLSASVRSDAGRYDISYRLLLRDGDEAPHEVGAAALPDAANEVAARLTRRLEPDAQKVDIRERYSFDDFANIAYAIGRQEYFTKGAQAAAPYFAVCIERDPEFAWAKLQLARCRNESGDVAATDALLDDAQKLAKRKGDRKLSIEVDLVRCDVDIERGKYEDVERIAKATLAESQQLGDMALTGHAQRTLGMVAWHRGRPDDARMWDRAALQTFTKLRSQIDVARIYNNMGLLEADGGDSRAAEQQFERAMSIAERYDDFAMMMKVLGNLATARLDALDFPGAERYARRQLTLARKSGSRGDEIYALVNGAIALWAMDRVEEALRDTEQAAQIAHEMQNPRVEAIALANAGFARANLGQFDAAKTAFDRATTIIATLESPDVAQRVDALAGYWLARIGKLDEAEQRTARAETVKVTIASLTSRARLSYARGDYKAAESAMRRAHELHDGWLPTHQRMWDAYAESARTGKPSTIAFESAPR
jgi:tetratricopeptide (TPR) repeat protein